jgi:small-conductance mechanosensitive channel
MGQINGARITAEPVLRYSAFDDSSINFKVFLRAARYADQFALKHEFIKQLHRRFREEGIVIPFPIRTLDLGPDGSRVLIDRVRQQSREA